MDGKGMFLRYAEGCKFYWEDKSLLSDRDKKDLESGNPKHETLRRVFYVAVPVLEAMAKESGRDVFDRDLLREFYSGEHNRRKFEEGQLACLAFPARVLEKGGGRLLVDLEPVTARVWVEDDIDAGPGDWVVFHRMILVERITEEFAMEMKRGLMELGLNKAYKFPKAAIKYLRELKRRGRGNV
ncbi:MAG: hypothetical protein DRO99_04460 [Candidatus Aenigmatarchaeota archaeon]|nr:MAG: hypothetical protein DRO99_04460 [Candidatus Aenigmarchaeota archaeon]